MPFARAHGQQTTTGEGGHRLPPAAATTPRPPEVEEGSGLVGLDSHPDSRRDVTTDVAIYELDGPYPLVKWLCDTDRQAWVDRDWTVKPGAAPGALKPKTCDDCELRRQKASA
jgi:hypothetical protein